MDSLNTLIAEIQSGLQNSSDLGSFASTLASATGVTASEVNVMRGEEFFQEEIALTAYPFVIIVIGPIPTVEVKGAGWQYTREIKLIIGIYDQDTERCTDGITTFEEGVVKEMDYILKKLWIGPDATNGLIYDYELIRIESDEDMFRPMAVRQVTFQVVYTLN